MKKRRLGYLFRFWWHIWKERNWRIFDNEEQSIPQLASRLQDDIALFSNASGSPPPALDQ
jgi:hypothetical protein